MRQIFKEFKVWLLFLAISFLTICNAFWHWIIYYSAILIFWWLIGDAWTVFWLVPLIFYAGFGLVVLMPTEIAIGYRNIMQWLNKAYKNEDTILEVRFNNKSIFKL